MYITRTWIIKIYLGMPSGACRGSLGSRRPRRSCPAIDWTRWWRRRKNSRWRWWVESLWWPSSSALWRINFRLKHESRINEIAKKSRIDNFKFSICQWVVSSIRLPCFDIFWVDLGVDAIKWAALEICWLKK